jgi:integrase
MGDAMPRGARVRIATGVYRDNVGLSSVVTVGQHRSEVRWPFGTDLDTIQAWQRRTRIDLVRLTPAVPRGSLSADIERYIRQIKHLKSWPERRAELRAWAKFFGPRNRSHIREPQVRQAIGIWAADGVAQKTITNRVWTLANLYRTLDGKRTPTPCDDITLARPLKTPPVAVSPALVVRVDAQLQEHERRGLLRDQKTRARFRVLAACGRRPSELKRAAASDLDLERRVWTPRNGKGGLSDPIYLNADMLAAWTFFVAADAWGPFNTGAFVRVLHHCGWPRTVRPYNLRHSVGIAMSDAGIDLSDIQVHMGHSRIATTRHFYVPATRGRAKAASDAIDGRFQWQEVTARPPDAAKPSEAAPKRKVRAVSNSRR